MAHVQNKPLKCQDETLSAILACTSDRGFEIPVVQLTTRLRITVANQTIPPYLRGQPCSYSKFLNKNKRHARL